MYYNADGTVPGSVLGARNARIDRTKSGFRLPTEAEWEYAARGADPMSPAWMYRYAGGNDIVDLLPAQTRRGIFVPGQPG
ncbi:MAG: formylglycine-generating enzyme family protein [Treponema sp.]|nr:formylglycine-generating enzyme family protein [Treponema sp.]